LQRVAIVGFCAALFFGHAGAHAAELPADKQALLLLRVLAYDRTIVHHAAGALVVAVVHRANDEDSAARIDAVRAALTDLARTTTVAGFRVNIISLAYTSAADLDARLMAEHVVAMLLAADLDPFASEISAISRRRSILSATGGRELVKKGMCVGLVLREQHPGLIVNLTACRGEDVSFDSELLSLAEVI
jgi:hypothetical protein